MCCTYQNQRNGTKSELGRIWKITRSYSSRVPAHPNSLDFRYTPDDLLEGYDARTLLQLVSHTRILLDDLLASLRRNERLSFNRAIVLAHFDNLPNLLD